MRTHVLEASAPSRAPGPPAPKASLLIVDDDQKLTWLLKQYLEKEGYQVLTAADGGSGLKAALSRKPDLILLDLQMPEMDGMEFLRRLRAEDQVPTLILTAQKSDVKHVLSFKLGADDYITKPFCVETLVARVESILRRRAVARGAAEGDVLRVGGIALDVGKREARVRGRLLAMTNKEFDLLRALIQADGRILSRAALLSGVWGVAEDAELNTRTVDQHVARIRKVLGDEGRRVLTVTHLGYRIDRDAPGDLSTAAPGAGRRGSVGPRARRRKAKPVGEASSLMRI